MKNFEKWASKLNAEDVWEICRVCPAHVYCSKYQENLGFYDSVNDHVDFDHKIDYCLNTIKVWAEAEEE